MLAVPPVPDEKKKYVPSGLQTPQHSSGCLFHPGRNRRSPVPSPEISQMACPPPTLAAIENRIFFPSGDQRAAKGVPSIVATFRGAVPSALATYRTPFWI